mmetsp:Transcript_35607/g.83167  ORF Transcript_35607/g.83167 Transcript_35607/m.83167 type:complete len:225 (-) Transcript_35607:222-896(-)
MAGSDALTFDIKLWTPVPGCASFPADFTSTLHHSFLFGSLPIPRSSAKRASSFFIRMSSSALKRDTILRRLSRSVMRQSQSVMALIVAVRRASTGFLHKAAISPKTAPSDRVQTRFPPISTSTSPLCRMYILSPCSPSVMMSVPGVKSACLTCSAMASTNFGLHCLKMGTSLMDDFIELSSSIRRLCFAVSPGSFPRVRAEYAMEGSCASSLSRLPPIASTILL